VRTPFQWRQQQPEIRRALSLVIDGGQWKEASESTPMPRDIRPQITERIRFVCHRYERRA